MRLLWMHSTHRVQECMSHWWDYCGCILPAGTGVYVSLTRLLWMQPTHRDKSVCLIDETVVDAAHPQGQECMSHWRDCCGCSPPTGTRVYVSLTRLLWMQPTHRDKSVCLIDETVVDAAHPQGQECMSHWLDYCGCSPPTGTRVYVSLMRLLWMQPTHRDKSVCLIDETNVDAAHPQGQECMSHWWDYCCSLPTGTRVYVSLMRLLWMQPTHRDKSVCLIDETIVDAAHPQGQECMSHWWDYCGCSPPAGTRVCLIDETIAAHPQGQECMSHWRDDCGCSPPTGTRVYVSLMRLLWMQPTHRDKSVCLWLLFSSYLRF